MAKVGHGVYHHIHMITDFATFLFGGVTVKCAC
jgi:hypothetical protein